MKKRPIIFKDEMVRAILEGRKTQTRRSVSGADEFNNYKTKECRHFFHDGQGNGVHYNQCPYGKVGDQLWVRETFGAAARPCPFEGCVEGFEYRADEAYLEEDDPMFFYPLSRYDVPESFDCLDCWEGGWKPSIHMPRWASRILLEIADVRVERLQAINPHDALAEGVVYPHCDECPPDERAVEAFKATWQSINGAGSWEQNPWVWVVEFKVVGVKQ